MVTGLCYPVHDSAPDSPTRTQMAFPFLSITEVLLAISAWRTLRTRYHLPYYLQVVSKLFEGPDSGRVEDSHIETDVYLEK